MWEPSWPGRSYRTAGGVRARSSSTSTAITKIPTICGTGTEDYFGGAWGFGGETYSTPFLGYPLYRKEPGEVPHHGLYRWHVMDPIRFKQDLKVTIQALGWWPHGKFQPLTDDIASVGYWYQTNRMPLSPPYLRFEAVYSLTYVSYA